MSPPDVVVAAGLSRRALRRALRRRRRALPARARAAAARALARRLAASDLVRGARHVAAYLPRDGEMDPTPLLELLGARGVICWLPVLDPLRRTPARLHFAPVEDPAAMRSNRFGIPEPDLRHARPAWSLDLVLLPLVGFDRTGARLGMGGGFYDATFDVRRPRPHRPRLVGLAHGVQEVDALPVADHDVPLVAIATELEIIRPDRGTRTADP